MPGNCAAHNPILFLSTASTEAPGRTRAGAGPPPPNTTPSSSTATPSRPVPRVAPALRPSHPPPSPRNPPLPGAPVPPPVAHGHRARRRPSAGVCLRACGRRGGDPHVGRWGIVHPRGEDLAPLCPLRWWWPLPPLPPLPLPLLSSPLPLLLLPPSPLPVSPPPPLAGSVAAVAAAAGVVASVAGATAASRLSPRPPDGVDGGKRRGPALGTCNGARRGCARPSPAHHHGWGRRRHRGGRRGGHPRGAGGQGRRRADAGGVQRGRLLVGTAVQDVVRVAGVGQPVGVPEHC